MSENSTEGDGTLGPIRYAWCTHPGYKRTANEDRIEIRTIVSWRDRQALLVAVADGLGGHSGGAEAAAAAVTSAAACAERWRDGVAPADWAATYADLVGAFGDAKQRIRDEAAARGERGGATTLVIAIVTGDVLIHLYCGDSRLYHFRGDEAPYITRDQSLARIYLDVGRIKSEAEATQHHRNTLFSVIGTGPDEEMSIEPDWKVCETPDGFVPQPEAAQPAIRRVASGDILILCSDGLWGAVDSECLAAAVREYRYDVVSLREELLRLALNEGGGPDNITFAILKIDDAASCTELSK